MTDTLTQPASEREPQRLAHIAVCIPTLGSMKALTAAALIMSTNLARSVGHGLDVIIRPGPYTHWNREELIEEAIAGSAATHAIFVDCDITFPAQALSRLSMLGKDIVGAGYNLKQERRVTTVKLHDPDGPGFLADTAVQFPAEPFRVAALGTGLMCIDLAAIEAMGRPLFPCVRPVGEDIAFCQNAEAAGLEVWCDPTIEVGHIGDYIY